MSFFLNKKLAKIRVILLWKSNLLNRGDFYKWKLDDIMDYCVTIVRIFFVRNLLIKEVINELNGY
jgi:hypothetical protein